MQAALDALMQGRTTIVIAHRLSTIEGADRIVVLDGGRIVEVGPHAALIANDGVYAKLHRMQFATAPAPEAAATDPTPPASSRRPAPTTRRPVPRSRR